MENTEEPNLELVLLELEMRLHDPVQESFSDHASRAAAELGLGTLFNTRIYGDPDYQRCMGLSAGEGPGAVALLFLSNDGRRTHLEDARTSLHPIAAAAMERPSEIGPCWEPAGPSP